MSDLEAARQLVVAVLRGRPSEPAARLKQGLQQQFALRHGRRFDHRALGFLRFSDFLAACSDLVIVTKPEGPGDILVSLKPVAVSDAGASPTPEVSATGVVGYRVPSTVWHAFTNPDPDRQRYVNRADFQVVHFSEPPIGDQAKHAMESVRGQPHAFAKVRSIPAATQSEWMREFIQQARLNARDREALSRLAEGTFTTSVGHIFSAALGARGPIWRQFQSEKVIQWIRDWASAEKIPLAALQNGAPPSSLERVPDESPERTSLHGDPRRLLELLSKLTENDLKQVLVPLDVVGRLLTLKAQ